MKADGEGEIVEKVSQLSDLPVSLGWRAIVLVPVGSKVAEALECKEKINGVIYDVNNINKKKKGK